MLKQLKFALYLLVIAGALFPLWDKSAPPATAQPIRRVVEPTVEISTSMAKVARTPIPIDETQPGAEVSLARNFYFIFDGSGSMNDVPSGACSGDRKFSRKIDGAKWAVRQFLKIVPDGTNLGLYTFDLNGQRERAPLAAGNRSAFLDAIERVAAGGNTPLAASIRFATDRLVRQYQKQLGYGEFRIVIVTDGLADGIPEAAVYAARYGIPIYAIGLCIGKNHALRQYAVSYRAADNFQDLAAGLEQTLAELPVFDAAQFE